MVMPNRAYTKPVLVHPSGATQQLDRVSFGDHGNDEAWLQRLLFEHPALIPVDEIEPVFAPVIAVARELPTPSGPLDLLLVSPEGYPTLIETKLWRNPQARREVVAQAIDYATQLSRWSYDDLVTAVRKVRPDTRSNDPLVEIVSGQEEGFDETRFIDALARNLRFGRMLLLIVGDGIHESVEQLAETLAGAPQLRFTLGLVELSLFRLPNLPGTFIVQPRVVMRTREVLRAVVEVRGATRPEDVQVTLPAPEVCEGRRISLTEEQFYTRLSAETSVSIGEQLRAFLTDIQDLGVTVVSRQSSVSLHYIDPSENRRFSFGSIGVDGELDAHFVRRFIMWRGLPERIALDYLNALSRLVPKSRIESKETKSGDMMSVIKVGARHINISELLPHAVQWRSAIEAMIDAIDRALRERQQ